MNWLGEIVMGVCGECNQGFRRLRLTYIKMPGLVKIDIAS